MKTFQLENNNSYNRSKLSGNSYDNIDSLDHDKFKKMIDKDTSYKGDEDEDLFKMTVMSASTPPEMIELSIQKILRELRGGEKQL